MSTPENTSDQHDSLLSLFGEALDLLAGIEARQKVLAKEIASIKAFLYNRDSNEIIDELQDSFAENLERERNEILGRVSAISNLPGRGDEN
jgi:hypothetical protein